MQVTDTTTFTDEKKRAEVDSWLYETCTQCLQHMVDVFVQFYTSVQPLLPRILDLLANFIRSAPLLNVVLMGHAGQLGYSCLCCLRHTNLVECSPHACRICHRMLS